MPHRRIAVAHVGWQHEGERRRRAELLALAFEREADSVGMRHAAAAAPREWRPARPRRRSARSRRIRAAVMAPRLAPCSAARLSRVWLAGTAWARRSLALCWRAACLSSISARMHTGTAV